MRAREQRPTHQMKRLLGRVAAVELLPAGGGRHAPDGADLAFRAVIETNGESVMEVAL